MNHEKLTKFAPATIVLAVATFLGLSQQKVENFNLFYLLFGAGAVIALLALAAFDYRKNLRQRSLR